MNLHLAKHYIKHFFTARNEHSLHSPFVFEFYNDCLKNQSNYYCFKRIEQYRNALLYSKKEIEIKDLGAGSLVNTHKTRVVGDIAKNSMKSTFLAQQLFRIVNSLNPSNILDIGASLGITTSYLAAVNKNINVSTLEGCPNTAKVARQTFEKLKLQNIELIEGDFKDTLPQIINKEESLDFVFFDGNHQYQATMDYFNICKTKVNENTCFVFDDIYWSEGMTKAWNEIKADKSVMISIDSFYFGICFFRTNQPKQHFVLR